MSSFEPHVLVVRHRPMPSEDGYTCSSEEVRQLRKSSGLGPHCARDGTTALCRAEDRQKAAGPARFSGIAVKAHRTCSLGFPRPHSSPGPTHLCPHFNLTRKHFLVLTATVKEKSGSMLSKTRSLMRGGNTVQHFACPHGVMTCALDALRLARMIVIDETR
jgi:hypothetical protein